jgi:hypothetical protein
VAAISADAVFASLCGLIHVFSSICAAGCPCDAYAFDFPMGCSTRRLSPKLAASPAELRGD